MQSHIQSDTVERANPTPQIEDLACNLNVFSDGERAEHIAVIRKLHELRQEIKELPDGFAFRYPDDPAALLLVAEFISREHRCCPFFALSLEAGPGNGALWLFIKGGAEIKTFLSAETNLL